MLGATLRGVRRKHSSVSILAKPFILPSTHNVHGKELLVFRLPAARSVEHVQD